MEQDTPVFRKKSTPAETKTSKEEPASSQSSQDTASITRSSFEQLDLKSERTRKIANLFSMALNEYRELRNAFISQRELGIRAEEVCSILRNKVINILEET
jgi:hypothetical protein